MPRCRPALLLALLASPLPLAAAMPQAARAADVVRPYYHAGSWDAFTARVPGRPPVCGIGNRAPDHRVFTLRFEAGSHVLTLRAVKPSWAIPQGTQVNVVMQIGQAAPWPATATGNARQIDWTIPAVQSQNFEAQFRQASTMTLSFPGGSEPTWTIPLNGSSAITDAFNRCVGQITATPAAPTQPYGGPTQPYAPAR
ncbi:MAG: hypothetical protein KGL12_01900 [Rhodospirillales bacterium]|nr:hypothetical protein [Rhodospirillales bacterium]